jgi:monoamine oxidase
MPRTRLFDAFVRALQQADALDRDAGGARRRTPAGIARRQFLVGTARATAAAALAAGLPKMSWAARGISLDVGIVGGGLAGLACADTLRQKGVVAQVYDAASRAGGRCCSLRQAFPGQVAERGGELIDNLHKTMLGYAQRFGLAREDVNKREGDVFYVFGHERYPEWVVVEEFRAFVEIMRVDLRRLSPNPTALDFTPSDALMDAVSLAEYLDGQNARGINAGPVARKAIIAAYEAEYGLAAADQSALNFLLFIHADRRSKFTPFGIFSNERWHLVDGNDRIVEGLVASLPGQIRLERRLVRARRLADGRIELTFDSAGGTEVRTHEAVVLTLPFSVLREVDLDATLDLPWAKRHAIESLGYGTNAKMMVGFEARPWIAAGGTGASYSDLTHHQATWETNAINASASRGVLTDYSSAARGASLNPAQVQAEAALFLADLETVFPGSLAAARRSISGDVAVHLEHWPSNPLTRGSYTCYRPGQFTTIAGHEGTPVGNLYFAGEHTNSFYEWQGFMEGAALSGIDAAQQILKAANWRLADAAIGGA